MDYKLHRPNPICHRTGRGFAVGEEFFSALVRGESGLERLDVAAEAWDGPPPNLIAWWRARQGATADTGPVLAPIEVLLDALEALADNPADDPLRYLLALQLVRRKALRIEAEAREQDAVDGAILFSCRRRDRDYRLRPVRAEEAADPAVAARLMALLWSGEVA